MPQEQAERAVTARRAATRARLTQAAVTVFAREGIRGATVEQICDEAGFTRGAFYSNFESMDDLIRAMVAGQIEQVSSHIQTAITAARRSSATDVSQVIEEAAELFVSLQPSSPEWVLTLADLRLESARSSELRAAVAESTSLVRTAVGKMLVEVLADVGLRFRGAPEQALEFLEAAYTHLTLDAVVAGNPPNTRELAPQLTFLLNALTKPV
ncbi:TetR/AcrR family transcriptional regulator [Aestuariimicrobium ganziense]|uniref:TetR/AcrR family transcriptional regulator n=1 Tax=Aestuariimicrobium ganziense TaxID=2773677 RepID=UPI001943636C|nr:TetR/AcrR family transcriptional regulator [Aestuariimicrobium ganziense]